MNDSIGHRVADLIERVGHCRDGRYHNPETGAVCVLGAFHQLNAPYWELGPLVDMAERAGFELIEEWSDGTCTSQLLADLRGE